MRRIYIILVLAVAYFGVLGCTEDYDEMNTSPSGYSELSASDIAGFFAKCEKMAILGGGYQLNQGLHTDFYAQHFTNLTTYFASDRYDCNQDWETWGNWYPVLGSIAPSMRSIYKWCADDTPENALGRVLFVAGMEFCADRAGAVPYDAGTGIQAEFVDQGTAYHMMLEDLTKAADVLSKSSSTTFASVDRIYAGDISKWLKFTNTMRMRIAMKLVNKEPEFAKEQAEAAYKSGVMTSADDDAWFQCEDKRSNYHNDIAQTANWNEYGMSSTMYSYMVGWNDPRIRIYFQVSPATGTYHATRNGMPTSDIADANGTTNKYVSNIGTNWVVYNTVTKTYDPNFSFPLLALPASDAFFLRAEGALRGWSMGGKAKDLYEQGIRVSMKSWGVADAEAEAYLSVISDPVAPNDFYDSPAVCTGVSVKYNDGGTFEQRLQQIVTQRWLALFTCSPIAWAEFRRTGYPIMYPVIKIDDPEIPEGTFIQRIWYPVQLKNSEGEKAMQKAYELNGSDHDSQASKLYFCK